MSAAEPNIRDWETQIERVLALDRLGRELCRRGIEILRSDFSSTPNA